MAKTIHALRRLSVVEEPNASFAIATAASPLAVPAVTESIQWNLGQSMLDPKTLQQYQHGRNTLQIGPRSGSTLSFKMPMFLTGTLADVSTSTLTRSACAGLLLLDQTWGGISQTLTNGSAAGGIPTATVITVTDAGGFIDGGCIGWVNSAGSMEIRELATVTGADITLKHAFSAAVVTTNVMYTGISLYASKKASPTSLQFLVEGEEPDDYWRLMGCMPSKFGIELAWGEIPMLTFDFQVTDWAYLGSGSLAGQTYSNYSPLAYNSGELLIEDAGLAAHTRTIIPHHSFSLECSLNYLPITSPHGVQGRIAYIQNHTPPLMTAKIGTYYEDQTWFTDRAAKTLQHVALQIGMSSSGGVLITLPAAQITEITPPSDANGLTGSEITLEANIDAYCEDQTTELRRSAARMHIVG